MRQGGSGQRDRVGTAGPRFRPLSSMATAIRPSAQSMVIRSSPSRKRRRTSWPPSRGETPSGVRLHLHRSRGRKRPPAAGAMGPSRSRSRLVRRERCWVLHRATGSRCKSRDDAILSPTSEIQDEPVRRHDTGGCRSPFSNDAAKRRIGQCGEGANRKATLRSSLKNEARVSKDVAFAGPSLCNRPPLSFLGDVPLTFGRTTGPQFAFANARRTFQTCSPNIEKPVRARLACMNSRPLRAIVPRGDY